MKNETSAVILPKLIRGMAIDIGRVNFSLYIEETTQEKVTNKDEEEVHHPGTLREMSLLSVLKHPNIVESLGMEFVKAGSFIIHMHLYEMTLKSFLHKKKRKMERCIGL